jgi:hypothetical protein
VLLGIPEEETVEQLLASQKELEEQAKNFDLPIMRESTGEPSPLRTAGSINPNVQRSPVFIYGSEADGQVNKDYPAATGFFVGIPASGNRLLRVFVTARHVVDRKWAGCGENPKQIYLRFNKTQTDSHAKADQTAFVRLETASFYKPDDDNLDVAISIVTPRSMPDWDSYDIALVWISLFATDEELRSLAVGDQVYTTGLTPSTAGIKKIRPSFAYATIASLPDEPSKSVCESESDPKLLQVWQLTPQLNPGRSGSPVFWTRNRTINGAVRSGPVLVGVQSMASKGGGQSGMTNVNELFKVIQSATGGLPGLDFRRGFH